MRKGWIVNLVLLVVAAAGGVLLYFEPWKGPPEKAPRIVDVQPDAVKRITVERPGKEESRVVLARGDDSGWRLAEPFAMRANSTRVHALIQDLRQRGRDHFPVADRDLAGFGLQEPKVRVTLDGTTVAIGGKAPIKRARYVRVGDTIHLADGGILRTAQRGATDLAARRLLPADATLTAIAGPGFRIAKGDDGWAVKTADQTPAKDAAKTLAQAWQSAQGLRLVRREGDGGDLEVDARLALKGQDQPLRFTRLSTDTKGEVAVTRPGLPVRYVISAGTADRLFTLKTEAEAESGKGADRGNTAGCQKS